MNLSTIIPVYSEHLGITEVAQTRVNAIPQTVALFSAPQFLVALIAGVLMAFAFQLLLTNFSVAFGISALGGSSNSNESESLGSTIRKIETAVGLWTLITVTIALFIACFLAVKLSLVSSAVLGAITAIVIWSTYFSLLVWVGSTTVGSLIGSVVSTATSGFQGLMGTAATAMGASAASSQVVSTAEAVTAAVRRELTSGIDPNTIRDTLQNSLSSLQLPKLDVEEIRSQFEKILSSSDLQSLAGNEGLNVDRQTLVDLVSSRTDFSKQDINRVVDQLEAAWKNVVGQPQQDAQTQIQNFLQSATPEELTSSDLAAQLQKLVASNQSNGQKNGGMISQAMELGASTLLGIVLKRTDLSDLDVEKISNQLQQLTGKATEQVSKVGTAVAQTPALGFNTIKADVDNYLLNSYGWHLNRETIKNEFKDVIYDPQADPATVRRQLEQINKEYFTQQLTARGDLLPAKIAEVAEQLESIRSEVLGSLEDAPQAETTDIRASVADYLSKTGKEELNPEGIKQNFQKLLEDPQTGFEALRDRLSQFDRDTFVQLLSQRQDISTEEAEGIVSQLESSRDSVVNRAREVQEQAKAKATELRTKVEEYLRNTNKEELNPDGIKRDFQTLFADPQAGISVLKERLSQFDRDTLVQLLSQRQDLSEEQINQTLDQIESVRSNLLQAPQKLAGIAQEQYEQTTTKIAEYLRNTNLEELDPEGIKRDLSKLLEDPKLGAIALRERLAQVDRETLVKLLSQRQDLSEEQVNKTIDQLQAGISSIVKAPRRLATRATQQVVDFEANLESYLRNTNKDELNPEGIKRDLQLLLNDPRSGLGSIGSRFSKFDRSTLVSLLSQREDISTEEANRIADQVESVRNSIVEQAQKIQQTVTSAVEGVLGNVRNYLNGLQRPELNYEGIQQDFSKVFDDPQAGFSALRERLSQFDRETLVAVLSSREDISEADANRIIAQVEGARDKVLQQGDRIQKETQKRLDAIKQQAQKQAEATKKAASGAAWWLFSTALTSLVASGIAGILAVRNLIG
ncbi:MAG: MFS transporter [Chroococcus sp. CMT-3BRIN-NPC107]|nr:MFS transporter [Chroococcus sp. CMT-3BRIN-NPC107]